MKRFLRNIVIRFKSVPLPIRIVVGVVLLSVVYELVFILPTNVQLSYANKYTCVNWLTVAPTTQHQRAGSTEYALIPQDIVKVFNVPVFGTKACVTPVSSPKEGDAKVSMAPFGTPIFSKTFKVVAPALPTANVASLKGKEISAVKRLAIPMSDRDAIHSYSIGQSSTKASCAPTDTGLLCDMAALNLEPSTAYTIDLYRVYNDATPVKVASVPIKTLTAVQFADATVKNDATIYDKPASFTFTFDRELDTVDGTLKRTDGTAGDVAASFKTNSKTVVVTPTQPLPRNASYQLTLQQVTGKDGGSLADPIVTNFKTSGGPKVANVSVGATGVPQSAKITVTFDQPLKADVDIAKLARVTGVTGSVAKASDNSVTFTLSAAPLCAAFSLVIDKGVPSGSNDETSADAWKFDGRIVCGTSAVIGSSVKGRPIVAYTFGTGSSTILFTGGIHGSEASGVTTMQAWVTYLQTNAYKIPAGKKVVVVPNTNPDGIAANTRYNANNVNLDRNFPASNWRPDIDTATGIIATGGGSAPGSEPETRALLGLTRQLRPRLEVSFHAQGRLVGANEVGDSTPIGLAYARTVGYKSMIGSAEAEMGYSITGEYEDWMGQELGVPAILIELPSNYGNYLSTQMTALSNILAL